MDQAMPDVLARICADTLTEVRQRREALPMAALRRKIADAHQPVRGFGAAPKAAGGGGRWGRGGAGEKAAPSGGLIRPGFDPAAIARAYEAAGATCLSVLTEAAHFQGEPAHLRAARAATALPVLRKDFMLDPWQIYESRWMGADCVLLIMAALSNEMAIELEGTARDLDMDVLVEVHDAAELVRALGLQTPLVGVNNRNLRTLQTNLETTVELASYIPPDRLFITESGIRDRGDVARLGAVGAQCLLVGESLLRQADPGAAVHELLGTCAP